MNYEENKPFLYFCILTLLKPTTVHFPENLCALPSLDPCLQNPGHESHTAENVLKANQYPNRELTFCETIKTKAIPSFQ